MPVATSAHCVTIRRRAREEKEARKRQNLLRVSINSQKSARRSNARKTLLEKELTEVLMTEESDLPATKSNVDIMNEMLENSECVDMTSKTNKTLMKGSFGNKSVFSTDTRHSGDMSSVSVDHAIDEGDSDIDDEDKICESSLSQPPPQVPQKNKGVSNKEEAAPPNEDEESPSSVFDKLQEFRSAVGDAVNTERVQAFVLFLIIINSIMLGIATFPQIKDYPNRVEAFDKTDNAFLIIFTIELALQFIYHGFGLFMDGWLVFDFLVVTISWAFLDTTVIRAFRIFRALRLVTRIEVMRNLVVAIFSVVPKMAAITMLLLLIFYIFAVMFTQLFKDLSEEIEGFHYFDRIDDSMFTLFQIMCLDEWSAIALDVMTVYPWSWIIFVSFVVITAFVVVNLIIAVICDAIQVLRSVDKCLEFGFDVDGDSKSKSVELEDPPELQERLIEMETKMDAVMEIQKDMAETMRILRQALKEKRIRERIKH